MSITILVPTVQALFNTNIETLQYVPYTCILMVIVLNQRCPWLKKLIKLSFLNNTQIFTLTHNYLCVILTSVTDKTC